MIHYESVSKICMETVSKECDKCHKNFYANKDDIYEMQEFLHVRAIGGYGSIFGDEAEIELDLCQHCVKELLGPYLRIGPDWLDQEAEEWKKREKEKNEV